MRILWEVDRVEPGHFRVLEDLRKSQVFYLTLAFRGAVDAELLQAAAGLPGCRVAVEAPPSAGLDWAPPPGIRAVNLDVTAEDLPEAGALRAWGQARGAAAGLKLELWGHTLPRLGEVLDLARAAGICRLALPNPRLVGSCGGEVLRFEHQALLAGILEARQGWLGELEPAVHDLFAWKAFARAMGREPLRGEYAGCQAYGALGYIDPAGNLLGCSSLRGSVGSLFEQSLQELWDSPARRRIRETLERQPEVCAGCEHLSECRSGCRGTVEFVHGHFEEADPGCPFHRPARSTRLPIRP